MKHVFTPSKRRERGEGAMQLFVFCSQAEGLLMLGALKRSLPPLTDKGGTQGRGSLSMQKWCDVTSHVEEETGFRVR